MKCFITHSGLNSVSEAIRAGIPMITIPLFAEQLRNSRMAEKRHISVRLNKQTLSKETLSNALKSILYDKR